MKINPYENLGSNSNSFYKHQDNYQGIVRTSNPNLTGVLQKVLTLVKLTWWEHIAVYNSSHQCQIHYLHALQIALFVIEPTNYEYTT